MANQLHELIRFISSQDANIRKMAIENSVEYSISQPSVFRIDGDKPIRSLKVLVQDRPAISEHAVSILVNLSRDEEVIKMLVSDDAFVNVLLYRVTNINEGNADAIAMLLANLTKDNRMMSVLGKKLPPISNLTTSDLVMNQFMDAFVKGSAKTYNTKANFDHLAYVFADLSRHDEIRKYFLTKQEYDWEYPFNKIKVFTEQKSHIRRKGVATILKNVAFDQEAHELMLNDGELNLLPYLLLPLTGNEEYDAKEMVEMLPDLQLLSPDKQREPDNTIILTHLETLTLLTATRKGREYLRQVNVYITVREVHARVDDEDVRAACDQLVQVLKRDEADDDQEGKELKVIEIKDDEDEAMVEV